MIIYVVVFYVLRPSSSHLPTHEYMFVVYVRREQCIGEFLLVMSTGVSIGGHPVLRVGIIDDWGGYQRFV